MQSIFRLPWASEQFGLGAADKVRFGRDVALSRPEVSVVKQNKKKRALTPDPEITPQFEVKKSRPSTASNATQAYAFTNPQVLEKQANKDLSASIEQASYTADASSAIELLPQNYGMSETTVQERNGSEADIQDVQLNDTQPEQDVAVQRRAKLCQAIENQISLQILLKHNEMRLIDQELAKCQVALEQLRRCELQPYPGSNTFDHGISTGTGPAVQPAQGLTVPSHAPPYGAVDGPYTRHYQQWLLPDPQFDSQSVQAITPGGLHMSAGVRAGRIGRKSVPSSSYGISQRHEFASLPQTIVPAPKKDNNMPLVLRRSTDGKLVKLVCNNCNRGNMSSIQGFLNHCRIAHKVVYESHDAAAKDCGRLLDEQELASLPTETQTQPVMKHVVKHTPSRAQSYAMAPPTVSASVHPLNQPNAKVKPSKASMAAKPVSHTTPMQAAQHASTPFKPAVGLPRLSALFARKQAGGDLEQAATEARSRADFGLEELISPAPLTPGSPAFVTPTSGRGGLAAAGNLHRVHGGKGRSQKTQHSYFAPAQAGPEQQENVGSPREMNLSPHAVDSNPGLVSDLEDDDNGSASEEESTAPHHTLRHPLGMNRTCGDSMDVAVADDDNVVHHGGVIIRRNSILSATDDRGLHVVGNSANKLCSNQGV